MKVVADGVAGVPDAAEALTLVDVLALHDRDRTLLQVHEGVVVVLAVTVEHHVPARATLLVLDVLDRSGARRDHGDAFRREKVLALVGVARAAGAEAVVGVAVAEVS